jgi:hypothetical protein
MTDIDVKQCGNVVIEFLATTQILIPNIIIIIIIIIMIVAYLLHGRTAEPQKQPLPSNTRMQQ